MPHTTLCVKRVCDQFVDLADANLYDWSDSFIKHSHLENVLEYVNK